MSGELVLRDRGLELAVSARGAEMRSLRLDGREYLWGGDPAWWPDRAPNLFPYVARLTGGGYRFGGRAYRMDIHGFVKDRILRPVRQDGREAVFELRADDGTLAQYPFPFVYRVGYRLEAPAVRITYEVENPGRGDLYFGLGGHPGFRLPLAEGKRFSDYILEFPRRCAPARVGFSDELFLTGEEEPFPLREGRFLPLRHSLFDDDAIVLRGTPGQVVLHAGDGSPRVRLEYPQFAYLGLWHTPRSEAPFLCIEPWASLPSRQGVVEDLAEQPSLLRLAAGQVYRNAWRIAVG